MSKHRIKTANQANFAQTVQANIPRSIFRRDSSLKTSFNCGKLVPIYCDEVLPGDTFEMSADMVSRLSTPVFPTMDNLILEIYAFLVPNRLVYPDFVKVMGENKSSAWVPTGNPVLCPIFNGNVIDGTQISKRIGDYYGIPVGFDYNVSSSSPAFVPVSALPYRGYALIWNEWFRDENLQAPVPIATGYNNDAWGASYSPNGALFSVNKFHDYFTSALPAPQKGDSPLVPIELNDLIPVIAADETNGGGFHTSPNALGLTEMSSGSSLNNGTTSELRFTKFNGEDNGDNGKMTVTLNDMNVIRNTDVNSDTKVYPNNLYADGRGMRINTSTISELRTAFQIQKLLEKDARGGTRYIEMLKSHFGVDAGDYRLQRPEFLGRIRTNVGMQSVPQTSSTDSTSPQGNLAAYSLTGFRNAPLFKKSIVEHGFIHIFAVARQVKTYQQGIEKFWTRRERYDYYDSTLAHISEQPIYGSEIYCLDNTSSSRNSEVFGYQEAWADYRYKPNRVSGQMRSGVTNSFDVWHYADDYSSAPTLSSGWITDNSDINVDRTLAISMSQDDQIRMDINFNCIAIRPMPVYSIPGLVDHF